MYTPIFTSILGITLILIILAITVIKNGWIKVCSQECLECNYLENCYPYREPCKSCRYCLYAHVKDNK